MLSRLVLVLCLFLVGACANVAAPDAPKPPIAFTQAQFADLPHWPSEDFVGLAEAFQKSCQHWQKTKPDLRWAGTYAQWQNLCAELSASKRTAPDWRRWFETEFTPYVVSSTVPSLLTGYYEPEIAASLQPTAQHSAAIYARPDDLIEVDLGAFRPEWRGMRTAGRIEGQRLVPYAARADIAQGALSGRKLELYYADPTDVFFMEIQGSGRLRLPDGTIQRVGYAAQNGRPYVAIGKVLRQDGLLPEGGVSMQSIRAWLAANPTRAQDIKNQNPSYVFFRPLADGPIGAQGVTLTALRSLAVDRAYWPLGLPVWLNTTEPLTGAPLARLFITQDTGGAIKGGLRGDVFFGGDAQAAEQAGKMQASGSWFVLLPRGFAPPAHYQP